MTAMPVPDPVPARLQVILRGELHDYTLAEAALEGAELLRQTKMADDTALRRRVRLGSFLVQVHRQLPYGRWGRWLTAAGIHEKSANNAAKLAGQYANEHGELDLGRLRAAVDAWNATHPTEPIEMDDARPDGGLSLRRAEIVAGARTPTGNLKSHGSEVGSGVATPAAPRVVSDEICWDDGVEPLDDEEGGAPPERAAGDGEKAEGAMRTAEVGERPGGPGAGELRRPPADGRDMRIQPAGASATEERHGEERITLGPAEHGTPNLPAGSLPGAGGIQGGGQKLRLKRDADDPHQLTMESLYVGVERLNGAMRGLLDHVAGGGTLDADKFLAFVQEMTDKARALIA
jgi:hypothetical protein